MGTGGNRRIVLSDHGGPEVLHCIEETMPEPGPGEVRLKVLAAGVSAFDLIYRRWSRLPGSPAVPFTLGEDVAGVVDAVGQGVVDLVRGHPVVAGTWALGVGGGYSEYVCLPSSEVVPMPADIDAALAVCLVVNYLTAHQHLHHIGRAQHGERLLVHGAAGGVGSAVLELGRLADLEMYGTASAGQRDTVESLGATFIDYRAEDFVERIDELTGDGVDIVVDPIGGANHLWQSYRVLRRGGRLVWLGSSAVEDHGIWIGLTSELASWTLRLVPDSKHVPRCPTMGKHAEANNDWYRTTLTDLLTSTANGDLNPVIAERIPLLEASRAHEQLEQGGRAGKYVLITDAYVNRTGPDT
jgi:NADPH:quinone reductase-like Zn-dependent oxidoreductase